MLKQELPTQKTITAYEAQHTINNGKGFDIGDDVFDWGNYFDCPKDWNHCKDYYDRVQLLIGLNLKVLYMDFDWYTTCNVTEFIEKNIKAINEFMNEYYKEGYRPMDFEKQYTSDDEEFWEVYFQWFFAPVLNGGFSEEEYEDLYKKLIEG